MVPLPHAVAGPPPLTDQHEADAQFYRATLHALIEHGTAMARDIATQASLDIQARTRPLDPGPHPSP